MDDGVQEARIEIACKELKMPGLRQHFRSLLRQALDSDMNYLDFLVACLEQELLSRNQKKQQLLLRQARFPIPKTLQEFDFKQIPGLSKVKVQQLAQCSFILPL